MAAKKKAKSRKSVPEYRSLSVDRLTKYRACFAARLEFARAFCTFGNVKISPDAVWGLSSDRIEGLSRFIGSEWAILSPEGRMRFNRSVRARGIRWPTSVEDKREHLSVLARYYIEHPRRVGS